MNLIDKKVNTFKNIELLRFLFILIVIAGHLNQGIVNAHLEIPFYNNFFNNTHWAWLPVDFFFIISGFFLFHKTNFMISFQDFFINKVIRLMPTLWIVLLITFILSFFTPITFFKHENIFTIFNIQNVGFTYQNGNIPPSWFVSSLFWSMCFYFYLHKICDKKWFNLLTAILIFLGYTIFLHVPSSWNITTYFYFINIGMVRAITGLGVGYFINEIYNNYLTPLKDKQLSKKSTIFISAIEIYSFVIIFYYLCFHSTSYNNFLFLIIFFIILFILFILNQGILSRLLNNNISVYCGKFTYSIFIIHYLIKDLWKYYICENYPSFIIVHPLLNILAIYIVTIFIGMFLYYFVEKKCTLFLQNKIKEIRNV